MAFVNARGEIVFIKVTSPEVVQANYLASWKDKHHVDDVINLYTGVMPWNWGTPPCSHTEIGLWLDDELWFFSSTSRAELGCLKRKKNGTRWIKAEKLLKNPERWLIQESADSFFEIKKKMERANKLTGLTYDFYGVGADFTNPYRVLHPSPLWYALEVQKIKKIYCSKAVHAVDTGEVVVFSPKRRYKWAKAHDYKTIKSSTAEWLRVKEIV